MAVDLDEFFGSSGYMAPKEGFRSGFVTLVGRPNAGKSTLLNALVGQKIAITSNTAQTTRHRLRAIVNTDDAQIILVDTPVIHKPHEALGEELNRSAIKGMSDVDVIAMLIDASMPVGKGDEWVANQVHHAQGTKMCILTKLDLVDKQAISAQRAAAEALGPWDAMVGLSSVTKYNLDAFLEEVTAFLPEGPAWFPRDMQTDQPLEVMIAEFVREKVLRSFSDELPHAIGVQVEDMHFDEERNKTYISAIIYVERESQKGMIIGKGGWSIKAIGSEARQDLERLLGEPIYLDLRVKVKKNWRRDATQIKRFGYGEGL